MSAPIDGGDARAELLAVMDDYFDALLRESPPVTMPVAAANVEPSVAEAPPPSASAGPMVVATEPAPSAMEQAAAPSYQLIRCGGLTLGIPSGAIAEVMTVPLRWTPLSDTRAWVLGSGTEETYTIVDTVALLMPGSALQAAVAVGGSVVLLAGRCWALACDGIGATITPDPAQINWRGAQGKRPWLAGTLREPICALLDMPALFGLLET